MHARFLRKEIIFYKVDCILSNGADGYCRGRRRWRTVSRSSPFTIIVLKSANERGPRHAPTVLLPTQNAPLLTERHYCPLLSSICAVSAAFGGLQDGLNGK